MKRLARRTRHEAAAIAALAGYVDAVGFLSLGGFFVSFMSGNSTRLAAGLAGAAHDALVASALIATFVAGVTAGFLVARRSARPAIVVALVAALLAVAALLGSGREPWFAAFVATFAMGAVNAAFAREGGLPVGLTYMTGTLVKLGQAIAEALSGGDRGAWWPYAWHWAALVAGATLGALAHGWAGVAALWGASGAAALIAAALWPRRGTH
ncbi:YoaK family protein [Dokdonella sp. MW10]|uniref:YoaK family protein n=1 Tax=Dokdonella sp. MW10 TaxID=2992926 RepID=UPI003F7D826C